MSTERQRETAAQVSRLPRKAARVVGAGRCVACDVDADETPDGLCSTCYHASVGAQQSRIDHPPCDHVPGCAGPGRCACICDPCIVAEDAETERRFAEERERDEDARPLDAASIAEMKREDLEDRRRTLGEAWYWGMK